MNHYTVPRTGTGAAPGPNAYRPDLPAGTSWVGNTDGSDYLVATDAEFPDTVQRKRRLPVQALTAAANARGFRYEDVLFWSVTPDGGGL